MKSKKNYIVFVACALFVLVVFSKPSLAKPTLSSKKISIGINVSKTIKAKGLPKGAKLIFKNNKPSVIKVSSSGKVTGIKVGTGKVTVSYKKGGKSTAVGTVNVSVKKAYLDKGDLEPTDVWIHLVGAKGYYEKNPGRDITDLYMEYPPIDRVKFKNPKAKYVYRSTDENKLKLDDNGIVTYTSGYGLVDIAIDEVYGKNRREVGIFPAEIEEPKYLNDKTSKVYVTQVANVYWGSGLGEQMMHGITMESICGKLTTNKDEICDPNSSTNSTSEYAELVIDEDYGRWDGDVRLLKEGVVYLQLFAFDHILGVYESTPLAVLELNIGPASEYHDDDYDDDDESDDDDDESDY